MYLLKFISIKQGINIKLVTLCKTYSRTIYFKCIFDNFENVSCFVILHHDVVRTNKCYLQPRQYFLFYTEFLFGNVNC